MKTYNELTLQIRKELIADDVEGAQLESRLLVAHAAGKTVPELLRDMNLYTTEAIADKALSYLQRRKEGEPVAYITGSWEFYGIPLAVTPDVLIPRMDTEVLVDAVKEMLIGRKMDARILDLCCGSGCIACALAKEMPATKLVCVDISASALQVCRLNIARNHLESRIICKQADALTVLFDDQRFFGVLGIFAVPRGKDARRRERGKRILGTLFAVVEEMVIGKAADGDADSLQYRGGFKRCLERGADLIDLIFCVGDGALQIDHVEVIFRKKRTRVAKKGINIAFLEQMRVGFGGANVPDE